MTVPQYQAAGIFSRGIAKLDHLEAFLPEVASVVDLSGLKAWLGNLAGLDCILGWGFKPTAAKARRLASKHGLPYLALEDGFLRSVGLGVEGAPPLSLVVDEEGMYYDASRPSRLESLLQHGVFQEQPELAPRARSGLDDFRRRGLSKYNSGRRLGLKELGLGSGRKVLVVDQCAGDASVPLSLADADRFREMLHAARENNPGAGIVIKTHPDVLAGKRSGYLQHAFSEPDVGVLDQDVEPLSLFEQVESVYTVSSLLGLEALIHGRTVHCFGLPFYAGWGLTHDYASCPRRTRTCSLEELFAAAYIRYPRYVDPYTGAESSLEDTMERIDFLKREYAKRPYRVHCLGVPRWKQSHVRPFLTRPCGWVRFHSSREKALQRCREDDAELVVWAAQEDSDLQDQAEAQGVSLSRLEDGFIRSCGLGSDLIAASSLILDRTGVHFNYKRPSDLETLLETTEFSEEQLERARTIQSRIRKHGISKYNSEFQAVDDSSWPTDRTRILVPGQVDDDAAVQQGTDSVRSNRKLLETVRQENPEAFLIYKIHPDVDSGNRKSTMSSQEACKLADLLITGVPLAELFPKVDEVHVLTSLAGFEALLAGKSVATYGGPFYAGWGLTRDRMAFPRRTRSLSMDHLVAGTLLSYPMYHDWQSGLPCGPERVLDRLLEQRSRSVSSKMFSRMRAGKGKHVLARMINGTAGLAGVVRK